MGFRFRKSANFGPLRINFSKSGVGYSVGGKGVRITKKTSGGFRTTASVPGTGLSYVKETGGKAASGSGGSGASAAGDGTGRGNGSPAGCGLSALWILAAVFLFLMVLAAPGILAKLVLLVGAVVALPVWNKARFPGLARGLIVILTFVFGVYLGAQAQAGQEPAAASSVPASSVSSSVAASAAEPTAEPTAEPMAEPTAAPTEEPVQEAAAEPSEPMVWIASTGNGTKYHAKAGCSRMNDPIELPLSDAQARGYEPCGICYK